MLLPIPMPLPLPQHLPLQVCVGNKGHAVGPSARLLLPLGQGQGQGQPGLGARPRVELSKLGK